MTLTIPSSKIPTLPSTRMMDNFGTSGEEAMNLIASGAQNGLDYSGELLDSISEYSVQFGKMGLDAEDMFSIFEKGAESGAFNLDKVGDAVKEMSIRVVDGSDTTREGFELLGLDADTMAQKFAAGGDTAKEALQKQFDELNSNLIQSGTELVPNANGYFAIKNITFPVPYAEIPNVTATVSNGDNNNSLEANIFAQVGRVSKTGCVLKVCCWNEQLSGSKFNVSWIAVGKREL